ncbi:DUF1684 domain-containing protein [Bacteroidota bacterium]
MRTRSIFFICQLTFFVILSCEREEKSLYVKEIESWQEERINGLKKPDGWLSLVGLYWLNNGENTFGSDSSNDIVFPQRKCPGNMGKFYLNNGRVSVKINERVEIYSDSVLVDSIYMLNDTEGSPTTLRYGALSWYIIKRGRHKIGVRLKDSESDLPQKFKGIDTFPIDDKWKVKAKFEAYIPVKTVKIPTIINTIDEEKCPGKLVFEIDDTKYSLDVLEGKNTFFIIFGDETNGEATYGAGRFLTVNKPDSVGKTFIDFNKAYNPPCVFTKYATCPLPPEQNMLLLKVTAGEKMFGEGHH